MNRILTDNPRTATTARDGDSNTWESFSFTSKMFGGAA